MELSVVLQKLTDHKLDDPAESKDFFPVSLIH